MYFNIKWQSSTMWNHSYFCTNLIAYFIVNPQQIPSFLTAGALGVIHCYLPSRTLVLEAYKSLNKYLLFDNLYNGLASYLDLLFMPNFLYLNSQLKIELFTSVFLSKWIFEKSIRWTGWRKMSFSLSFISRTWSLSLLYSKQHMLKLNHSLDLEPTNKWQLCPSYV